MGKERVFRSIRWGRRPATRYSARRRVPTRSERTKESEATTHAERANHCRSKKVRAKVRITSQIETSSAGRENAPRATGARLGGGAHSALCFSAKFDGGGGGKSPPPPRRVGLGVRANSAFCFRAKSDGGHGCKK